MKKLIPTFLAVVTLFTMATAQNLQVVEYDEVTEVNSTAINDYSAHVKIKNIGTSPITVNCRAQQTIIFLATFILPTADQRV